MHQPVTWLRTIRKFVSDPVIVKPCTQLRFPMLQYLSCLAFSIQWCIGDVLFIFVRGNVIMCGLAILFLSLCLVISFSNTLIGETHVLPVVRYWRRVLKTCHYWRSDYFWTSHTIENFYHFNASLCRSVKVRIRTLNLLHARRTL